MTSTNISIINVQRQPFGIYQACILDMVAKLESSVQRVHPPVVVNLHDSHEFATFEPTEDVQLRMRPVYHMWYVPSRQVIAVVNKFESSIDIRWHDNGQPQPSPFFLWGHIPQVSCRLIVDYPQIAVTVTFLQKLFHDLALKSHGYVVEFNPDVTCMHPVLGAVPFVVCQCPACACQVGHATCCLTASTICRHTRCLNEPSAPWLLL